MLALFALQTGSAHAGDTVPRFERLRELIQPHGLDFFKFLLKHYNQDAPEQFVTYGKRSLANSRLPRTPESAVAHDAYASDTWICAEFAIMRTRELGADIEYRHQAEALLRELEKDYRLSPEQSRELSTLAVEVIRQGSEAVLDADEYITYALCTETKNGIRFTPEPWFMRGPLVERGRGEQELMAGGCRPGELCAIRYVCDADRKFIRVLSAEPVPTEARHTPLLDMRVQQGGIADGILSFTLILENRDIRPVLLSTPDDRVAYCHVNVVKNNYIDWPGAPTLDTAGQPERNHILLRPGDTHAIRYAFPPDRAIPEPPFTLEISLRHYLVYEYDALHFREHVEFETRYALDAE